MTELQKPPVVRQDSGEGGEPVRNSLAQRYEANLFGEEDEGGNVGKAILGRPELEQLEVSLSQRPVPRSQSGVIDTLLPLINPQHEYYLRWTALIFILILSSAFLVPLQLAFFAESGGWVVYNGIVDVLFVVDILVHFNTPVVNPRTGQLCCNRREIAGVYLRFWFWIDVVSVFPFNLVAGSGSRGSSQLRSLRLLRIFRLGKLLKLVRVSKLSGILDEFAEAMELTEASVSLLKNAFAIELICHLMSCCLYIIVRVEDVEHNFASSYFGRDVEDVPTGRKYVAGLYWAAMTSTTIGYGDLPMITASEQLYGVFCMAVGATMFALVTGNMVSAVMAMRKNRGEVYYHMVSQTRYLLHKFAMPESLKRGIRQYVEKMPEAREDLDTKYVLQRLSPALRGIVAERIAEDWITNIPFLKKSTRPLIYSLCVSLQETTYCPNETIYRPGDPSDRYYIIADGNVLLDLKPLFPHESFGEEMVLRQHTAPVQRTTFAISSIKYVTCNYIDRSVFISILRRESEEIRKQVRFYAIRLAFRRYAAEVIMWRAAQPRLYSDEDARDRSVRHVNTGSSTENGGRVHTTEQKNRDTEDCVRTSSTPPLPPTLRVQRLSVSGSHGMHRVRDLPMDMGHDLHHHAMHLQEHTSQIERLEESVISLDTRMKRTMRTLVASMDWMRAALTTMHSNISMQFSDTTVPLPPLPAALAHEDSIARSRMHGTPRRSLGSSGGRVSSRRMRSSRKLRKEKSQRNSSGTNISSKRDRKQSRRKLDMTKDAGAGQEEDEQATVGLASEPESSLRSPSVQTPRGAVSEGETLTTTGADSVEMVPRGQGQTQGFNNEEESEMS